MYETIKVEKGEQLGAINKMNIFQHYVEMLLAQATGRLASRLWRFRAPIGSGFGPVRGWRLAEFEGELLAINL